MPNLSLKLFRHICALATGGGLAVLAGGPAFACTTGTNTETCTFSGSGIASFGPTLNSSTNVTETSTVTVPSSVITGPITAVTVTITGLNATEGFSSNGLNNFSFLLAPPNVSSSEKAFDFLNSTCDTASNATLTIDGSASSQAPDGDTNCSYSGSSTYKPYNASGLTDVWPAAIGSNFVQAPPDSTGSFAIFNYSNTSEPVGTWTLYISDENPDCFETPCDAVSISGWTLSITFTPPSSADFTTTSLSPSASTVLICPSGFSGSCTPGTVTLTATVTDTTNSGTTVDGGTVTFFNGASAITCSGGDQTVSSGTATCVASFSPPEGAQTLTASYGGVSGTFDSSNSNGSPVTVTASDHTQQSGNQYCNIGTLTSGDIVTTPLPSNIFIGSPDITTAPSGGGLIDTVSVTLQTLSTGSEAGEEQQNFLLVGPNGGILLFDANGGTETVSQSLTSLAFADSGSTLAYDTALTSSTTYKPLSYFNEEGESQTGQAAFPSGTPSFSTTNEAAPTGSATFESTYTGSGATGTWSLYYSSTGNNSSTVGGWCLDFTMTGGAATTTTVSSNTPTALTDQSFNLTATVNSATTGTVTFIATTPTGGSTTLGQSGVGSNNKATLNVPAGTLTEGTYEITAEFADSSNSFGPSQGTTAQRINNPPPTPSVSGNTYTYCNTTPIVVPYTDELSAVGNAAPYPSNIIVSNLPGTLDSLKVQLKLASNFDDLQNVASLLAGPNGSNIDFFSNVGGFGDSSGTFNIFDGAGAAFGQTTSSGAVPAGSYPPESYTVIGTGATDAFPACPSQVSNCSSGSIGPPAPTSGYNYATTSGSSTFSSVFGSGSGNTYNANGTWSLYLYADVADHPLGTVSSWCVELTENLPVLAANQSGPASVIQGGTGSVTLSVENGGPGSAGGSTVPVSVSDTFPTGLTPTSGSGTNWTCGSPTGQTISCTNSDFIGSSSDLATLTLNFSVATNATPGNVSNTAVVSGSGLTASVNSNAVTIDILGAPTLAVSKSHTGTFTQGQTAEWDITVSNTAASGSTGGTTTVLDTLPSNYSLNNFSGTGWSCSSNANAVTCTSTQAVAGGSSFATLKLIVNVPANSPTSVSNTASAYGGGDLTHTGAGTAAVSNTDNVSVTQVAASVVVSSGSGQSANVSTAFTNPLVVTVKDAAGVVISGASVTFTAPGAGASGTFSNSSNTITANTNGSGQVSESFTANASAGGPYTVTATSNSITTNTGFSLTNTPISIVPPTISISFSAAGAALGGTVSLNYAIQNPNAGSALTGVSLTDALPAGLAVANPPGVTNTCGGTFTAVAGSSSTSLTGARLAAGGSCAISVKVQATSIGFENNTTGPISANESGPGNPSNTASLDVVQAPTVTLAFGAPSIPVNGTTSLTFTVTNPSSITNFFNIGLTDTLPSGLVVASPNGMLGTCLTLDGALVIADPGSASISITSVNLLPSSSCAVTVNVTGTTAGSKNDSTGNITATFSNGGPVEISGPGGSAGIAVVAPPSISAAFSPASIVTGGSSSLTFTITNPALNTVALSGVSFIDALPSGLTVSTSTASACAGTVTTNPGTGIVLSNGSMAVNSQCQFSVTVTGSDAGSYTNTTGAVVSSNGGTGNTASANLTVENPAPPTPPVPPVTSASYVSISPISLTFTYAIGQGGAIQSRSISVSASSPFSLASSVAPGTPWLSATTSSLSSVTVTVNAMGLAAGTYQGQVLLSISLESSPVSVPVTLTVIGPPVLTVSAPSLSFTAFVSPGTVAPSQTKSILLSAQNSNVAFSVSSNAPWLSVASNPSNTPSALSVTVNPSSLPPGTYSGSLQIVAPGATNSPLNVAVTLNVVSPLVIAAGGFQNAASFQVVPGAANTIMAIYGSFGCAAPTVMVNNSAAELIGHTASMITFTLPATVDGESSAAIAVVCNGQQSGSIDVPLAAVSPGIFTLSLNGSGQGAIVNQDGSVNGVSHPAALNSYVSVYATGFGDYLAPSADGLQLMSHTVQAFIGGVPAQIQFAGHAPGETLGLQQINVLIPSTAPTGPSVTIQLVVDGVSTQSGVTLAIQ